MLVGTLLRVSRTGAGLVLAAGLAGCATADVGTTGAVNADAPMLQKAAFTEELADPDLSCKTITGRMQVRIAEIRDYNTRMQSSGLSQLMQTFVTSTFGGSKAGSGSKGAYDKDVAQLEAYNAQLRQKGCQTLDLAAELAPDPGAAASKAVPASSTSAAR